LFTTFAGMKFGKLLQELIDENPAMNEQPLIR
jgi:hypothetical protein